MADISLGWPDLVGFIGVAFLLTSYAALQFGKLSADDPLYSVLNALAALLILFSLFFTFNAASFCHRTFLADHQPCRPLAVAERAQGRPKGDAS